MVKDQEVMRVLAQLNQQSTAKVAMEGSDVTVRAFDDATKLSLTTIVYTGSSYIPKSVRLSIQNDSILRFSNMYTYFSIDEENFNILLHYLGKLDDLKYSDFKTILEEFSHISTHWRNRLDDLDNNDRIYIHQKKN